MWHWHESGWAWVWMTVMMVGFWAVVVVGVAMLVRTGGERWRTQPGGASTPEDVLAERFARGEIEVDEYERSREVLAGRGKRE
jgi:putative membrane protein